MKREIQITGKTANCSTKGDGTKRSNLGGTGSESAAAGQHTPVSAKLFVPACKFQILEYTKCIKCDGRSCN